MTFSIVFSYYLLNKHTKLNDSVPIDVLFVEQGKWAVDARVNYLDVSFFNAYQGKPKSKHKNLLSHLNHLFSPLLF
jgi:hypothetical protein